MDKVIYCEYLFQCNPIERKLSLKEALKRFKSKTEALKGYVFKDACFIGIKDLKGNWIKKN